MPRILPVLWLLALAAPAAAQQPGFLLGCGDPNEPPERAASFCRRALDGGRLTDAQRADATLNLGLALNELGRFAEAAPVWEQAVALRPDARALAGRARAREGAGERAPAAVDWNRAVELAPGDPDLRAGRGGFRLRSGNAQGALADFDAALARRPQDAALLYNRGLALAELRRDAEAEQAFSQVIAADPDDVQALMNRARLRVSRDREAALADFDRAVALGGDWPQPYVERGALLDAMGRRDAAEADFRRAWELGDRSPFLAERMATMGR
jgi:tetratricopeptide (TPR) repeat protein